MTLVLAVWQFIPVVLGVVMDHTPKIAWAWWQFALIALILLLVFGGKRLPGLAKSLGTSIREFKKNFNSDEADGETGQIADPTASTKAELDRAIAARQAPTSAHPFDDLEHQIRTNPNLSDSQREAMLSQLTKK